MFTFLTAGCLFMIAFEDFRRREVHITWFILLCSSVVLGLLAGGVPENFTSAFLTNLMFILVQWLGISLFFSIKNRAFTNIMDTYIGWGDAVLIFILAIYFPPISFALFLTGSFILVLFIALLRTLLKPSKTYSIPLAGWLGIFLISLIGLENFNSIHFQFSDDFLLDSISQIYFK